MLLHLCRAEDVDGLQGLCETEYAQIARDQRGHLLLILNAATSMHIDLTVQLLLWLWQVWTAYFLSLVACLVLTLAMHTIFSANLKRYSVTCYERVLDFHFVELLLVQKVTASNIPQCNAARIIITGCASLSFGHQSDAIHFNYKRTGRSF